MTRGVRWLPAPVRRGGRWLIDVSAQVRAGRDAAQLARHRPDLLPNAGELALAAAGLRPTYDEYLATVSGYGYPASLETSALLLDICRRTRAQRVLDLGSGFSSYVLRRYAAESPSDVQVVSVDDSIEWLRQTQAFLPSTLPTGEFELWSVFRDRVEVRGRDRFDVVFHDLAVGQLREEAMAVAMRARARGGVIIFDDAQHAGHRRRMLAECRAGGVRAFSMRRWTLDCTGRYAMLGVP